jgi:3-oxoacyl-[acyl-carrier protein] reductase
MSAASAAVNTSSHHALPRGLLREKVAVVTGGSRGIGRATALRLAEAGARVIVHYCENETAARVTAQELRQMGGEAVTFRGDLRQPECAEELANAANRYFGRLDILVANAGIWQGAAIESMADEIWDLVMDVNLRGTFRAVRAAVPAMKQLGGGSIVIVSSTAGQRGEAGYCNYAASKGGQISLTKSLAVELAPAIRVNCVAPGWVDTEMNAPVFGKGHVADPSNGERTRLCYRRAVEASIPLRRLASADDVALSIVFLASDWARHITGEVLNINGGSVLCG